MKELGEGLKSVIRGAQGLAPEEDAFSGLINVKDLKERTRLPTIHDVFAHSYLYTLGEVGGEEWAICKTIATTEEALLISLEGEQRKEAILMQRAKTEVRLPGEALGLQPIDTTQKLATKEGEKKNK